MKNANGYWMYCSSHNYITLMHGDDFIHCYDNNLYSDDERKDEYYTEHIIKSIERRTGIKFNDIPIKGKIEDFDGLRFLCGGFRKGSEFINQNQIQ